MTDTSDHLQMTCDEEIDSLAWRDEWAKDPAANGQALDGGPQVAWKEVSSCTSDSVERRILGDLFLHPAGVSNKELAAISYRFGARIFQLRKRGAVITKTAVGENLYIYRLIGYRAPVTGIQLKRVKAVRLDPELSTALANVNAGSRTNVTLLLRAAAVLAQWSTDGWLIRNRPSGNDRSEIYVARHGRGPVLGCVSYANGDAADWARAVLKACNDARAEIHMIVTLLD